MTDEEAELKLKKAFEKQFANKEYRKSHCMDLSEND